MFSVVGKSNFGIISAWMKPINNCFSNWFWTFLYSLIYWLAEYFQQQKMRDLLMSAPLNQACVYSLIAMATGIAWLAFSARLTLEPEKSPREPMESLR